MAENIINYSQWQKRNWDGTAAKHQGWTQWEVFLALVSPYFLPPHFLWSSIRRGPFVALLISEEKASPGQTLLKNKCLCSFQ